jgi:hypothetical protein
VLSELVRVIVKIASQLALHKVYANNVNTRCIDKHKPTITSHESRTYEMGVQEEL